MKPRAHSRRGMTLLEAALATAMLAIVGMALIATVQSIWRQQLRQEQTLGAAELANRLVLNFLDDDTDMPSQSLPVPYGPYRYRWSMSDDKVATEPPDNLSPEARRKRDERANKPIMDRFRAVTIRVWLNEENQEGGGSFTVSAGSPQFEITRLYDPLCFKRNPDTVKKLNDDPERLMDVLAKALGMTQGPRSTPQGGRTPGRSGGSTSGGAAGGSKSGDGGSK